MRDPFPRLTAMRAQRETREAEIAAPLQHRLQRSMMQEGAERRAREEFERMTRGVAVEALEELGKSIREMAADEIMKIVQQSLSPKKSTVNVSVPIYLLMSADRGSVASAIAEQWRRNAGNDLSLHAYAGRDTIMLDASMMKLSVRVPEIHVSVPIESGMTRYFKGK
jgi:hypothetical protein